jgi:hypothetical protein
MTPEELEPFMGEDKVCPNCKETKNIVEDFKLKRGKRSYGEVVEPNSWCTECRKERSRDQFNRPRVYTTKNGSPKKSSP